MLLAQQDDRPLVEFTLAPLMEEYGIPLAVMGVLVVFAALVLIIVFITILPRILAHVPAHDATVELDSGTAVSPAFGGELSAEIVVVIAAAVAETIGKPHRIVKIRGLTPADLGWSLEGRTQHHQSHRFRHRNR